MACKCGSGGKRGGRISHVGGGAGSQIKTYESLYWLRALNIGEVPLWSRLRKRNGDGDLRHQPLTRQKCYDIELGNCLYSLWGNLHPDAIAFDVNTRGRQYLACNAIACCAAVLYPLPCWNAAIMDAIIVSGDRYHFESFNRIRHPDFAFSLEHYNQKCTFTNVELKLHFEHVAFGALLAKPTPTYLNLCSALVYFFSKHRLGILQMKKRSLAIGQCGPYGYFMFDCQAREFPLFKTNQGAPYVLRAVQLVTLIMCINETIKIDKTDVEFHLHSVDVEVLRKKT